MSRSEIIVDANHESTLNLKKWFHEATLEKVLKVLEALAARFKKGGDVKPNWREAVNMFTNYLDNKLEPPLKDAVETVINGLKLTGEVEAVRTFWKEKVPEQLRDTTKPIGSYGELIKLELFGKDGKGVSYGDLKGPLDSVINFSAKANLALVLQSLDRDAKIIKDIGINYEGDQRFLRMGVQGKLEASAGASFPFGFVGVKGDVKARGTAGLDYYYVDEAEWLFIEALAQNLPHLASPFDAADISREAEHRLKAIHLNIEGSLGSSLDVSGGKVWGTKFKVKSLEPDTEIELGASIKAGFQAELNLKGTWNVLVKPEGKNMLNVKVQKAMSKDKSSVFSLDASVGASGLDVVGNALVKKFMPEPDNLIDKLKEYSNFGDLLKMEIVSQLDDLLDVGNDDTLKKGLVKALAGDTQVGDLADVVGDAVKTTLNENLDALEKKAANTGQELIRGAVEKLNLPTKLGTRLVNTAKNKLDEFLNNIEEKLKGSLVNIINENRDNLTKLFKPLELVGGAVKNLTKEANELSRELLNPVIKYLNKYQKFRNKMTAAVENSSKAKIELYLKRSLESSSSTATVLEFKIDASNEKARECFKEMVAGNFKNALREARETNEGAGGITLISGIFENYMKKKLTMDVSLNFFGVKFTTKTIMKEEVDIQNNIAGDITIISKSKFKKVTEALGESRMIHFINLMELRGSFKMGADGTDKDKQVKKLLTSDLSIIYKDEKMKKRELKAFLGSLEDVGLISASRLKTEIRRHEEATNTAKEKGQRVGTSIEVGMTLNSDDIWELITTDENKIISTAINKQIDAYFQTHNYSENKFNDYLGVEDSQTAERERIIRELGAISARHTALNHKGIEIDEHRYKYLTIAWSIGRNAVNLKEMVSIIKKVAVGDFDIKNRDLQDPEKQNEAIKKAINGYNKKINGYLKNWLKVRGWLSNIGIASESIPYTTLAFMAIIIEICQQGEDESYFLTPKVERFNLDEQK